MNVISFYSFIPSTTSADVTFQKFYDTSLDPTLESTFLGSPEIYWWPEQELLMVRRVDGYDWKTYKFTSDVIGVAQNKNLYNQSEWIENGL